METNWEWVEDAVALAKGKVDEEAGWWKRHFVCWLCKALEWDVPVPEARDRVLRDAGCAERKRSKVEKFEKARSEMRELYDFIGAKKSNHAIYELSRNFFQDLFQDMSEMLLLKVRQMQAVATEMEGHAELLQRLREEKDPAKIRLLVDEIDKINEKGIACLAYSHMAEKEQHAMINASAYADEWAQTATGHFRSYFICLAGGLWPCLSCITSKGWSQKFPGEAWVPGQKWGCVVCPANYKAKFGCVVEIKKGKNIYYARAECPTTEMLDARAMLHQKKYAGAMTPAQLYAALPVLNPTTTEVMLPVDPEKGVFKVCDKETLERMPKFEWESLYTFVQEM